MSRQITGFLLRTAPFAIAIGLFSVCPALAGDQAAAPEEPQAAPAVAAPVDSDGDLIPDESDPMPHVANLPLYWSAQGFSISRTSPNPPLSDSWTDSLSLVISATPASVPLGKAAQEIKGHPFAAIGLYGSGAFPWGELQRERARKFRDGFRRDGGSSLTLSLSVVFINLTDKPITLDIGVPVLLGGKKYAVSVLSDGKDELDIPANGNEITAAFTAVIPEAEAADFLSRLAKSDVPPVFDFEHAFTSDGYDLEESGFPFGSIASKTVEVSVSEPAGHAWRWRVARSTPNEDMAILTNRLAAVQGANAGGFDPSNPNLDAKAKQAALTEAAWHGSVEAWTQLGLMLLDVSSHEGLDWLELAAAHGSVPAYARLSKVYRDGEFDSEKDAKKAAAYLRQAADGGDVPSMVALAEMYRVGDGVRKNERTAAKYFAAAAEVGDLDGKTWYALCLLEGTGVRKDTEAGITWLRNAADAGYDKAQYLLGVFLFAGYDGVDKNQGEAFALFSTSAKTQVAAKIFVGYCLLNGLGTAKDEKAAASCFREAADANVVAGQIWLAHCYANGLGVEKNLETARVWAKKAADAGNPAGRKMLLSIQE